MTDDGLQSDVPVYSEKVATIMNDIGYSELCRPDLDLTAHINKLFPTEQSLSQLDNVIDNIEREIDDLSDELCELVEAHGKAGVDGKNALAQAKSTVLELEQKIRLIRSKTQSSEDCVHEMTKDIKQLDIAKCNLTGSITTLHHLHLLLSGVNSLNAWIVNRQYADIATELPAVLNVLQLFDDYSHVEQVRNLTEKVQKLRENLSLQVSTDLKHMIKTGQINKMTADICRVADVLGPAVRNEFCRWYINQQLAVYTVLYSESEDVAWIDKIEERYRWFVNKLAEFERSGSAKIFPSNWYMGRSLALEFCILTRQSLDKLMTRRRAEVDWKLLAHAITHTSMFETLLCKRFPVRAAVTTTTGIVTNNMASGTEDINFDRIIWEIFDKYMNVFIASQSLQLTQFVNECAARIRSGESRPSRETHTTAVPLTSSAELFLLLKRIITESNKLCAQPDVILKELTEVFSQCLRSYAHGCLSVFLPTSGSTNFSNSFSSTAGAADSSIALPSGYQSFMGIGTSALLQNLMRDDSTPLRLNFDQQFFTCCLLATADWCAETTLQLQEKLRQRMSEIDLNQEVELFYSISNNALTILVQDTDAACDASLQTMIKINWANIEAVGDESPYVAAIRKQLKASVPLLRDYFADRRKYFAHYCLKLVSQLVNKFLGALFKCKPISVMGAEQLLLDAHALKTFLLVMPSVESSVVTKPPVMYTNTVVKGMTKAEMILKAVMADMSKPDDLITHYARMLPDSDSSEFQKVLEMRGTLRRSEMSQLVQLYRARFESNATTYSTGITPSGGGTHITNGGTAAASTTISSMLNVGGSITGSGAAGVSSSLSAVVSSFANDAAGSFGDSSMRRLEKLVKKKF